MPDDLTQKLADLERQRTEIQKKITESESILSAIDDKIEEFKRRQKERIVSDNRVDNNILDSISKTETEA